jgi:hypothetical protein
MEPDATGETTVTKTTITRFAYLGTTDERTTCECCGKKNLKGTVAIRDIERDTDHFFGSVCAARALKLKVAEVRKGTADADAERQRAEWRRLDAERRARWAAFEVWITERWGTSLLNTATKSFCLDYDKCMAILGIPQAKVFTMFCDAMRAEGREF